MFGRKNNVWRKPPAASANTLNNCCPLTITRLNCFSFAMTLFRSCNYHMGTNIAHTEASLVKIVDIFIDDPISLFRTSNQVKSVFDNFRLFVQGSLATVRMIPTRFQLGIALDKVGWSVNTHWLFMAFSK